MAKAKKRSSRAGKPLSDAELDKVSGGTDSLHLLATVSHQQAELAAQDLVTVAGKAAGPAPHLSFKYDLKGQKDPG